MKKKSFTFTSILAVLVIASTSYAWESHGYFQGDSGNSYTYGSNICPGGRGQAQNRGNYGMGQRNHRMGMYSWLTTEQQNKLNTLRQKFIDETAVTRTKLINKQRKLRNDMTASSPDRNKIKLLVKRISVLKGILMEKRIDFRLHAKKIAPFLSNGNREHGYGRMHQGMGRAF